MGKGKKAQNESSPHIVGSEKSTAFTMMLNKGLKVAIERVQATPLRWPLASIVLRPLLPNVREMSLKMLRDESSL